MDRFFKALSDPLSTGAKTMTARLTVYDKAKAAEERRRREEEERIRREEADRCASKPEEQAKKLETEQDLERALEAEAEAEKSKAAAVKAAKAAEAKPAEMHRTRGDYGSMSSLRQFWNFRVKDYGAIDYGRLAYFLDQNAVDKAVRAFIKQGGRELRGVDIFEDETSRVR